MPEMLEIEEYRLAADPVIGRTISAVHAPDEWYAKGATTPDALRAELPGLRITGTRRIGKLMLVDTDGPVLGLRYGMTGRILVDDTAPIAALEYSSDRNDPAWDRFGLDFAEGGSLVIRDPRRLGGVELDPDESRLGPMRRRSRSNPSVRSSRHRRRRSRPDSWIRRRSPASAICWPTTCSTARGWRRIGPPTRCRTMSRRSCTGRCAAPSRSWAHGRQPHRRSPGRTQARWGVPTMPDGRVASRRCGGSHHLLVRRLSDLNPAQPAAVMMGVVVGSDMGGSRQTRRSVPLCTTVAGRCLASTVFVRYSSRRSSL